MLYACVEIRVRIPQALETFSRVKPPLLFRDHVSPPYPRDFFRHVHHHVAGIRVGGRLGVLDTPQYLDPLVHDTGRDRVCRLFGGRLCRRTFRHGHDPCCGRGNPHHLCLCLRASTGDDGLRDNFHALQKE